MGHGSIDLSHKTLSNNDEKKFRFFVSDYLKEELVTETNENNDFTTMIPIGIILCFIEHLYYLLGQLKYLAIFSFL